MTTGSTNAEQTTTPKAPKASTDYLQDALEDLDKARGKAGDEAEEKIDAAMDRIRDARERMTERGQGQVDEWRSQLESAAEDVRRELGRFAVRAQRSPEALTELSNEIDKRRAEIVA